MTAYEGPPTAHRDRALGDLAAEQEGIVTSADLAELGVGRGVVERLVRQGWLRRLYPGVYAVGHARLGRGGLWLAAVWACGPRAVLSHRDAAALHAIRRSSRRRFDVSTPDRGRKGHPGIDLHRVRRLHPADVAVVDGIPVTTVARTIVDLSEVCRADAVAKAFHEADVLRLLDVRAVEAAMGRVTGRRTLRPLRALLATARDAAAGGELARRFLELCRRAGLPEPVVGTEIAVNGREWEVDFAWPAQRLCVETDGWAVHGTRSAFERDPVRDADFLLEGGRVVRFTWRRIRDEPDEVVATVRRLLATPPLFLPTVEGGPFAA